MSDWLSITRGDAPLVLSIPHAGLEIPGDVEETLADSWRARKDADWRVDELYAFAAALGATVIKTNISRTVIDMNRDPSGASLYPGQATTELCPTITFDGEPLYQPGCEPSESEIARRRAHYLIPYHTAIADELARLRRRHQDVVLYDAHSIRSHAPMLFDGALPIFNIGTNGGVTCAPHFEMAATARCAESGRAFVVNGRFKGGYITRHFGKPENGVHAIQMELALRSYFDEPEALTPETWPRPMDAARARDTQTTLRAILTDCIALAEGQSL
ncbi:MAG TPA: N-formylglutamate deformylase [Terricaulis sp.]|nr:N-formylglutamate deformylase [Terricaulis sp.]